MLEFVRHPAPSGYLRGRRGWRGGTVHGRYSSERVVVLLQRAYPETLTVSHMARELEVPLHTVELMAFFAWRNGRVEFALGTFDLLYRAIPEIPTEAERFQVVQIRADTGHMKFVVRDTRTGEHHTPKLFGRTAADTLCRQLNKEKSNVSERTDAELSGG